MPCLRAGRLTNVRKTIQSNFKTYPPFMEVARCLLSGALGCQPTTSTNARVFYFLLMDKHERSKVYKSIYRDAANELYEQAKEQRKILEDSGITLVVFKSIVSDLIIVADFKPIWSLIYRKYCEQRITLNDLSIQDFTEFYFGKFTIGKNGVGLKSIPDDRL